MSSLRSGDHRERANSSRLPEPRSDPRKEGPPMLSSVFTNAPAGVLGTGSVDARPELCASLRPALLGAVTGAVGARVPAIGLPSALDRAPGMSPIVRGWGGARTASVPPKHARHPHAGTTPLGNHSPRRPLS